MTLFVIAKRHLLATVNVVIAKKSLLAMIVVVANIHLISMTPSMTSQKNLLSSQILMPFTKDKKVCLHQKGQD